MAAGLIFLLAMPFAALAADGAVAADQQAAWQARLDKAAALQAEGKARQAEADQVLVERNAECATKFLINDCRRAASREHLTVTRETRRQEIEGNAIEREVKREQMAERAKQRAEVDRPRGNIVVSRRAVLEESRAEQRAEIVGNMAEGEKRKIAEAEKQQRKQADHDARVAKKMREAEQRAAQSVEKK